MILNNNACKTLILFTIALSLFAALFTGNEVYAADKENLAVIFVVDDSGSMAAYDPYDLRYTAVKLMISSLEAGDKVGFIRFSTGSERVTDELVTLTTAESKVDLINAIEVMPPDGFTDFLAALQDAQFLLNQSEDLSNHETIIVFLTDGYPYPADWYPTYLDDVITLSAELMVPIYAIALTPEGQSATLNQMAQVSDGQLIFANTAEDLLDSYLQVLGELKDRTVIRGEDIDGENAVLFTLDPALINYVSKVSFVTAHTTDVQASLISPAGNQITSTSPAVEFFMMEDPAFSVVTIDSPTSGDWLINFEGTGNAQARAIIHSRLRANFLSPENVFQAGKPITFVVNLIEEMEDGSIRRIVGEANFSADIELPDGSLQSLDRFYDDGTFGDEVAGDGNFSRQFVDTTQSGTYRVTIRGSKDIVPVTTFRSFTAIEIPGLSFTEPRFESYEVSDEPIPITVEFDPQSFEEESFEGELAVQVVDPQRNVETVILSQDGNAFRGELFPLYDGDYHLRTVVEGGYYLGVEMTDEIERVISVRLIPGVITRDHFIGLDTKMDPAQFTVETAEQGIPVTINVYSTSTQQEYVSVTAEGLSGFSVLQTEPILLQPSSENKITVTLIPDSPLFVGDWSGHLSIRPVSSVNVSEERLPVAFSIAQPGVILSVDDVIVEYHPVFCFRTEPVQLIMTAISTSEKEEVVVFSLAGIEGVGIENDLIYIQPGQQTFELRLDNPPGISSGDYAGTLTFASQDTSLTLENPQGGTDLRFGFSIANIWERCRRNILLGGLILLFLLIILRLIVRRIKERTKTPLVVGTLFYWKKTDPDNRISIDLNAMNLAEVLVGSDPSCDIFINDPSIRNEHFKLQALRDNNRIKIMLLPLAEVARGYRRVSGLSDIEDNTAYSFGDYEFLFINDPNLI